MIFRLSNLKEKKQSPNTASDHVDHHLLAAAKSLYLPRRVLHLMPPKKQPTIESGGTRVSTRSTNANKHPGTEAKETLRVQRDPEIIRAEKERRKAAKDAKEEARHADAAQREVAQKNLDEWRARQAASLEDDNETFPERQTKSKYSFVNLKFDNTIL